MSVTAKLDQLRAEADRAFVAWRNADQEVGRDTTIEEMTWRSATTKLRVALENSYRLGELVAKS